MGKNTARTAQSGRAIITTAINNVAASRKFVLGLETYAKWLGCPLYIGLAKYQNISLFRKDDKSEDVWWDPLVMPYAATDQISIGPKVLFLPQIPIQATSPRPLARKNSIGGIKWTIYCHPTTSMQLVAAPPGMQPKRMYTTGCVTKPVYSTTEAGKVAEFHHSYCALLVEWRGGDVWVRQLSANSAGVFCDLGVVVKGESISRAKRPAGLVLSDEHVGEADELNLRGTFGPQGIVTKARPRVLVRHDIFSGYSVNHHEFKQPTTRWERATKGQTDVRQELENFVRYLKKHTPPQCTSVIAPSNHHDHLDWWVEHTDAHMDPANMLTRADLMRRKCQAAARGGDSRALVAYAAGHPALAKTKTVWLTYSQDYFIKGISVGQHGHIAANAARGSRRAFARLPYKSITGHSHEPGIDQGAYSAGGMPRRMAYERGYSSHDCSHVIIYEESGKRSMIDIVNGRCCLEWLEPKR